MALERPGGLLRPDFTPESLAFAERSGRRILRGMRENPEAAGVMVRTAVSRNGGGCAIVCSSVARCPNDALNRLKNAPARAGRPWHTVVPDSIGAPWHASRAATLPCGSPFVSGGVRRYSGCGGMRFSGTLPSDDLRSKLNVRDSSSISAVSVVFVL
jgi:hypothetical protein